MWARDDMRSVGNYVTKLVLEHLRRCWDDNAPTEAGARRRGRSRVYSVSSRSRTSPNFSGYLPTLSA